MMARKYLVFNFLFLSFSLFLFYQFFFLVFSFSFFFHNNIYKYNLPTLTASRLTAIGIDLPESALGMV